ncbi:MAG TPA: histidine phosphatase family protein [Thermoflexales bacterium]|nr:histidine phosphatase family protein [Thermoflexales bacterium]HQW36031.1 histidine phosphatase family protein [Thermoflexales bacterium]
MRLIICRHGESEANVLRILSNRDLPHGLTPKGQQQARDLAEKLANDDVRLLYASHILRAQQTAAIVGQRLGLNVRTSTALRDFDCGIYEGRGDPEAWAAHDALVSAWLTEKDHDRRIPTGESYNDIKARFEPFLRNLAEQHAAQEGAIAIIMHGAVMMLFLPALCRNLNHAFGFQNPIPNCGRVVLEPQDDGFICADWNGLRPVSAL